LEWADYQKEHPKRFTDVQISPEVRYAKGISSEQAFAESIEYCERSMIPRDWQKIANG
jgi:hypothetical protein